MLLAAHTSPFHVEDFVSRRRCAKKHSSLCFATSTGGRQRTESVSVAEGPPALLVGRGDVGVNLLVGSTAMYFLFFLINRAVVGVQVRTLYDT